MFPFGFDRNLGQQTKYRFRLGFSVKCDIHSARGTYLCVDIRSSAAGYAQSLGLPGYYYGNCRIALFGDLPVSDLGRLAGSALADVVDDYAGYGREKNHNDRINLAH